MQKTWSSIRSGIRPRQGILSTYQKRHGNTAAGDLRPTERLPSLIVHSQDNQAVSVENNLQLFEALRDHGIPTEMRIFPDGGPGFSTARERGEMICKERLVDQVAE